MNWGHLIFGSFNREQILEAVNDDDWQIARVQMLGDPLGVKYRVLEIWLQEHNYSLKSKIQVTNYVNALKRGGLIQ